jgi:hypothetical protein
VFHTVPNPSVFEQVNLNLGVTDRQDIRIKVVTSTGHVGENEDIVRGEDLGGE